MIIMVSGKQGSGKTTAIEMLRDHYRGRRVFLYSIKQPIGECSNACWDIMEQYGFRRPSVKDGRLEQLLGTEWGRETIAPDVWVQCARNWVYQKINKFSDPVILIDSVRFPNELSAFPEAFKVRLECPSEIRRMRCGLTWREKPHISESALDDYDNWDVVFPTDRFEREFVRDGIVKAIKKKRG